MFSVPGATWEELRDQPALRDFAEDAAIANLAIRRVGLGGTPTSAGYLTMSAGTRAVDPDNLGELALAPGEGFENGDASQAYERRTGKKFTSGAALLTMPQLVEQNDDSRFAAELGLLGDSLDGYRRVVIGNADRSLTDSSERHREVGAGLMNSSGIVPDALIDESVIRKDSSFAYGLALSADAVVEKFTSVWDEKTMVLVEASDLVRAAAFQPEVTNAQADEILNRSWDATDALFASLMRQVDLSRDAVLIVAPPTRPDDQLGVFALGGPDVSPGWLYSSNTRTLGLVTLADSSVLLMQLAGIEAPKDIEGRKVVFRSSDATSSERFDDLVTTNDQSRFRNDLVVPVTTGLVVCVALVVFSVLGLTGGLQRVRRWLAAPVEVVALGALAFLPLTYLAALVPFYKWGKGQYFAALIALALAVALLLRLFVQTVSTRVIALLGAIWVVPIISIVFLNDALQKNTVFGDSSIVAGRFYGVGNLTFAQMTISAVLLAAFLVGQKDDRAHRLWASGICVTSVIVGGLPMWGADVGSILAGVPATVITIWVIWKWRFSIRTLVIAAIAALVAVAAAMAIDLSRPASERSHLGRLGERVGDGGVGELWLIVHRKVLGVLASFNKTAWIYLIVAVLIVFTMALTRSPRTMEALRAATPAPRIVVIGFSSFGLLEFALNDSGIAIPGMMLAVLMSALAALVADYVGKPILRGRPDS